MISLNKNLSKNFKKDLKPANLTINEDWELRVYFMVFSIIYDEAKYLLSIKKLTKDYRFWFE